MNLLSSKKKNLMCNQLGTIKNVKKIYDYSAAGSILKGKHIK